MSIEYRRQIAIAQIDAVVDVLSAWRGRYEDDDRPATIDWLMAVIPQTSDDPLEGVLYVAGTTTPGLGWRFDGGLFRLASICGSLRGQPWPVSRRQFRDAAMASGVSLPSRHATLYLFEK